MNIEKHFWILLIHFDGISANAASTYHTANASRSTWTQIRYILLLWVVIVVFHIMKINNWKISYVDRSEMDLEHTAVWARAVENCQLNKNIYSSSEQLSCDDVNLLSFLCGWCGDSVREERHEQTSSMWSELRVGKNSENGWQSMFECAKKNNWIDCIVIGFDSHFHWASIALDTYAHVYNSNFLFWFYNDISYVAMCRSALILNLNIFIRFKHLRSEVVDVDESVTWIHAPPWFKRMRNMNVCSFLLFHPQHTLECWWWWKFEANRYWIEEFSSAILCKSSISIKRPSSTSSEKFNSKRESAIERWFFLLTRRAGGGREANLNSENHNSTMIEGWIISCLLEFEDDCCKSVKGGICSNSPAKKNRIASTLSTVCTVLYVKTFRFSKKKSHK